MSQPLDRLTPQYDQTPAATVMHPPPGSTGWPGGSFGNTITDVETITAHFTAGWPRRDGANTFVQRYTAGIDNAGIGPQLYISGDGTVARLIDLDPAPRLTWHAEWINGRSLGVETGNLGTTATPPASNSHGVPYWIAANSDADNIPGAKLYITSYEGAMTEVSPCWWTIASYAGPGRGAIGAGHMLFGEQVMQAWGMVARYLMTRFELPRNFPLLPHLGRSKMIGGAHDAQGAVTAESAAAAEAFRRTVLADERAGMLQGAVSAFGIASTSFDPANAQTMATQYNANQAIQAAVVAVPGSQRQNRAWTAWCKTFRGLHGHAYVGSLNYYLDAATHTIKPHSEHDCPGPLFDFHRLAREVSDYWWYPFDVAAGTANVERRPYRKFDATTPIIEYYFDEVEADRTGRIVNGALGATSSPDTFSLEEGSPVYAMSNGELVAASFPDPGAGVSMAFTLVRHEVYYARRFPSVVFAFGPSPLPDSIDYDQPPESVYTLYMHVGRAENMSFASIVEDNPDWLNRLLQRSKECDLGTRLYDDDPAHHQRITPAVWNNRPPGVPQRPTTLEGWRQDKNVLDAFLANLAGGRIGLLPRRGLAVPARILLGDFLGVAGVISTALGTIRRGVRVETFAPSFTAPSFTAASTASGWTPSPAASPACLQYASEWARELTDAEKSGLAAQGINLDQLGWWFIVVVGQLLEGSLSQADRLPADGVVNHYRPLEFAKWINGVTWASEWPKFKVTDATGTPVPLSQRPRPTSRRV